MDLSDITRLISSLRAQTARDSITPNGLGSILQRIVDAISSMSGIDVEDEAAILQRLSAAESNASTALQAAQNAQAGAAGNVIDSFSQSQDEDEVSLSIKQHGHSARQVVLPAASSTGAGIMTATDKSHLDTAYGKRISQMSAPSSESVVTLTITFGDGTTKSVTFVGATAGTGGKAGMMTKEQADQLAALVAAGPAESVRDDAGYLKQQYAAPIILRNVTDTVFDDLAIGDVYYDTGHLFYHTEDQSGDPDIGAPSRKVIYYCLADQTLYRWTGSRFVQAVSISSGDVTVPTKLSDLINDMGFLTAHQPLKTINGETITGTGNITIDGAAELKDASNHIKQNSATPVVLRNVAETMLDDLNEGDVYFDSGLLFYHTEDQSGDLDIGAPSRKVIYYCLADGKMYRWNGNTFQPILAIPDMSALATKTEVATGLATKQDTLTFDNTPTANSNNPVKSGGVKQAIDDKLTEVTLTEISGAADIVVVDDAELAFIDQQGNIAMQVADGHIQTSEFDSAQVSQQVAANTASVASINQQIAGISGQSDVAVKNEDDAPFDISDAGGNVVLRVNGQGHIQTKGYDSQFAAMTLETPMCICHAVSSPLGDAYNHTMKHFRTAIARGHQFIECDGYNCMDGVPVCAHNSSYSFYVKNSTTGETASKSFLSINSADLIAGYTWTAPTIEDGVITEYGEPIIKVTDLLYFVCYIHRCNLYIDAKGMNTQSVKNVLDYADSIGCRQLVWIEPSNNAINLSGVQCNICAAGVTLENMASKVAANKRDGYNLMLQFVKSGATSQMRREFAEAAHSYGCYAYTWSMNSAQETRGWFDDGFDFIFTEGYTTVTWYITKYTVFNLQ